MEKKKAAKEAEMEKKAAKEAEMEERKAAKQAKKSEAET